MCLCFEVVFFGFMDNGLSSLARGNAPGTLHPRGGAPGYDVDGRWPTNPIADAQVQNALARASIQSLANTPGY